MGIEAPKENKSNSNLKNEEYFYIWADSNIKNSENSEYTEYLSNTYANTYFFTNIKDAMKCLQKIKFNLTYFIVSGSLFAEFISKLKALENKISTIPKVIIFTSESTKQKIQGIKEVSDSFYNIGGLAISFEEVQFFLNKNFFGKELNYNRSLRREKIQTGGDFSFQIIENKNDLVGPVYLSELIMKPYKFEYILFDKYLIDNYGDIMNELIFQIYNIDCPISLRIKYWLRAYTLETKFYKDMNSDLMKGKSEIYIPYIKLIYTGLKNDIINVNVSDDLYRGALINIEEIKNLIDYNDKRKNSDIPCGLIYCKSFMSFSLDKEVALYFMYKKNPTEKTIRVLYILKHQSGFGHINATNADLSGISYFENEREILLFPFSVYEFNSIIKKENYYEINLNYLGKYKNLFHFKNKADLYNSIIKSKFIKELELAGLPAPIWLAEKSLCKIGFSYRLNGYGYGSGFCCLIPLPNKSTKIPVLITCNHVLKEEKLQIGNIIKISYDDGGTIIEMLITKDSKIYTNKELDATIIEMEQYNNTTNKFIFMDVDEDIFNDKDFLMKVFRRKKVYILEYAKLSESNEFKEKKLSLIKKNIEEFTKDKSYRIKDGIIIDIDKSIENRFYHNIQTDSGASGGPIISYNKNKVIGYHIGKIKDSKIKIGFLLKQPIQEFIKKFYS